MDTNTGVRPFQPGRVGALAAVLAAALVFALLIPGAFPAAQAEEADLTFPWEAQAAGYYTLRFSYESPAEGSRTMSLFLNGRFAKTLRFEPVPEGLGQAEAPVYLPRGASEIALRVGPEDGRVAVNALAVEPRAGATKLIVVPHEDDEIFAFGGVIQHLLQGGDDVRVAFLTNGDFFGVEYGPQRILESAYALDRVGLPRENLFVLGYPDCGLTALLDGPDPQAEHTFDHGAPETYGNPDASLRDYHSLQTGRPARLTGGNLLGDMRSLLAVLSPSEIYTTSRHDHHADHSAAWRLVDKAVRSLRAETGYAPKLHESVVHGDDHAWPERLHYDEEETPLCVPFTNPFPKGGVPLDWAKATKIQLTPEMQERKYEAIGEYYSQNELFNGAEYDFSYYKTDEFYWTTDYSQTE